MAGGGLGSGPCVSLACPFFVLAQSSFLPLRPEPERKEPQPQRSGHSDWAVRRLARHLCKWLAPEMLVSEVHGQRPLDSGVLSQSDPDTLSTSPASMRFSGAKLLLREGNA